jgi:hypothetical protein
MGNRRGTVTFSAGACGEVRLACRTVPVCIESRIRYGPLGRYVDETYAGRNVETWARFYRPTKGELALVAARYPDAAPGDAPWLRIEAELLAAGHDRKWLQESRAPTLLALLTKLPKGETQPAVAADLPTATEVAAPITAETPALAEPKLPAWPDLPAPTVVEPPAPIVADAPGGAAALPRESTAAAVAGPEAAGCTAQPEITANFLTAHDLAFKWGFLAGQRTLEGRLRRARDKNTSEHRLPAGAFHEDKEATGNKSRYKYRERDTFPIFRDLLPGR